MDVRIAYRLQVCPKARRIDPRHGLARLRRQRPWTHTGAATPASTPRPVFVPGHVDALPHLHVTQDGRRLIAEFTLSDRPLSKRFGAFVFWTISLAPTCRLERRLLVHAEHVRGRASRWQRQPIARDGHPIPTADRSLTGVWIGAERRDGGERLPLDPAGQPQVRVIYERYAHDSPDVDSNPVVRSLRRCRS